MLLDGWTDFVPRFGEFANLTSSYSLLISSRSLSWAPATIESKSRSVPVNWFIQFVQFWFFLWFLAKSGSRNKSVFGQCCIEVTLSGKSFSPCGITLFVLNGSYGASIIPVSASSIWSFLAQYFWFCLRTSWDWTNGEPLDWNSHHFCSVVFA